MAKRVRLPLLLCLAVLVVTFTLVPTPASASPSCDPNIGPGSFSNTDYPYGYADSACEGGDGTVWCLLNTQHYTWDCDLDQNGDLYVTNVVYDPPQFCNCGLQGVHYGCCD